LSWATQIDQRTMNSEVVVTRTTQHDQVCSCVSDKVTVNHVIRCLAVRLGATAHWCSAPDAPESNSSCTDSPAISSPTCASAVWPSLNRTSTESAERIWELAFRFGQRHSQGFQIYKILKKQTDGKKTRKLGGWEGKPENKRADRILNLQIVAKYMYAIFKLFVSVENAGSVQGWRGGEPLLKSDGHLSK
jgi:hypothetical protein